MTTKKPKSVKRGACSFTVSGVEHGETFYGTKTHFPVSWRGRDAATRMVKRRGYRHAVLALQCGPGDKKGRGNVITLVSCEKGVCEVLGGASNKRVEHRHRGKAGYNRTIAGTRSR